jgi:hypothetical protein
MIDALVMTAAMMAGPDHLGQPLAFDEIAWEEPDINYNKPMSGGYTDDIVAAAFIPEKWRPFSKCVLGRESGGTLTKKNSGEGAKNPNSSASGRWQFLDSQWRSGLASMVASRLEDEGVPKKHTKGLRAHLKARPINKWDGWFQDIGHRAVISAGGWRHWSGGNGCNSLVP